ncbi:MAG: ASCH domain-containing protein [Clostridiales bacterium]|nr:ASCH domain-containing protein [Clostridiales bacterium]
MKCLTIKQPYAELIASGIKKAEIRSWKTKYRGEIFIHAGLGIDKAYLNKYKDVIDIENLDSSAIIAKCNVVDCVKIDENFIKKYNEDNKDSGYYISNKNIGNYAFILEDIQKIDKIPAKGKLSFWEYKEC